MTERKPKLEAEPRPKADEAAQLRHDLDRAMAVLSQNKLELDVPSGLPDPPSDVVTPSRLELRILDALRPYGDSRRVRVAVDLDFDQGLCNATLFDAATNARLDTPEQVLQALRGK